MFGAEFTHHGEDCTFETLIKRFALDGDVALVNLAEIVHDIDLRDDKFNRLEASGLDAVLRGLAELLKDDRKLIRQSNILFDGLYTMTQTRLKQAGIAKDEVSKESTKRSPAKRR